MKWDRQNMDHCVEVDPSRVEEWIEQLKNDKEARFIMSGNRIVIQCVDEDGSREILVCEPIESLFSLGEEENSIKKSLEKVQSTDVLISKEHYCSRCKFSVVKNDGDICSWC